MQTKKVFLLLPDGVGLRNFAFSDFCDVADEYDMNVVFWNHTPFDLAAMGFEEIKIRNKKVHPVTDILKAAKISVELNQNIARTHDDVYDTYRFDSKPKGIKAILKRKFRQFQIARHNSVKGASQLQRKMENLERTTDLYRECLETLKTHKPDIVFCSNQRPVLGIAPMIAARDLGIPTAAFIFSWDNLPKATKVIDADFYFVWSAHMKSELLFYYPDISESQIIMAGTPQFEGHSDASTIMSRADFFKENGLDLSKKYICYSGDDHVTSPNDPEYLDDVANAVAKLNANGENLGLLFRRCPVDFSARYDDVLAKHKNLIVPVNPKWEKIGEGWNTIMPTKADAELLQNTIAHTEMVVNLGSSMVFDYVSLGKPCAYINYDVPKSLVEGWSVKKIYNFVHFRSMPSRNAVVWLDSPDVIADRIASALQNHQSVPFANEWFRKIALHPTEESSKRIWQGLSGIVNQKMRTP